VRKGSGPDQLISSGWHLFGAIFFSGLFQCRENFFAFGRTSCELKSRAVEGQCRGGEGRWVAETLWEAKVLQVLGKQSANKQQATATFVSVLQLPWVSIEHSLR